MLICKGARWRMRSATACFGMGFLCMPWPGTLRRLADSTGDSAADASVMRWNRAASPAAAASFGAQACTAERKSTLPTHPRHVNMLTVRVWMVHALCVQRRRDCTASLLDDCGCVCNAVIDPGGPPVASNAANPDLDCAGLFPLQMGPLQDASEAWASAARRA